MAAHNGLVEAVLKLVQAHPGVDKSEITARLSRRTVHVKQALYRMRQQGILHVAGPERFWRYFPSAEAAQAHDARLHAEVEERRRLADIKQVRQANLRRKAQRQADGRASNNNRSAAAVRVSLAPGAVLAPDVVVTIAPPPRDRYAPDPGWRGQITADWQARRQSSGAAT